MSQPSPNLSQAKITQRLALRTLCLILLIGALILGYRKYKDLSQDLTDVVPADTTGWIAAIQFQDSGQRVVAFDPSGKMVVCPGWKPGNNDRDLSWNASGNRLYFVSDRAENNFHIFRWNPTDGSEPVQRTTGRRSHGMPEFAPQAPGDPTPATALITSGGYILDYEIATAKTHQVLPPIGREVVQQTDEEGGGSAGQFSGIYEHLGKAFKLARWCKGKSWIASIMQRDDGESLVLQSMTPTAEGNLPLPEAVAAGEHVSFDVNPADGTIVYCVQNFMWPDPENIPPQFRKGSKATKPYLFLMGRLDPDDKKSQTVIALSNDDKLAFGSPVVSPDGASIVFTEGPYENSNLSPKFLCSAPVQQRGYVSRAQLDAGEVYEPCWSPDGNSITFIERVGGKRAVCTIQKDGSAKKTISADGDFQFPLYSPQKKG